MLDMSDLVVLMGTMGINDGHKLVLKVSIAAWKKNPELAFQALAASAAAAAAAERQRRAEQDRRAEAERQQKAEQDRKAAAAAAAAKQVRSCCARFMCGPITCNQHKQQLSTIKR